MAVEADIIYRNRQQVAADFLQRLQARIPDVWVEEDGNLSIFSQVEGEILEGVYLANQLLRDNIFIQRANITELRRHGEQHGLEIKPGTFALGTVRLSGAGGTVVHAGAVVGFEPGVGDPLYYTTSADVTIPNPGFPTAPTLADAGAGVLPAGTYEYVVTFTTVEGESLPGTVSAPLTIAINHNINLTAIPLGGAGTTGRKLYRQVDGGVFQLIHTFADNTTTTYTDNVGLPTPTAPPTVDTAKRVSVAVQSELPGSAYNAAIGAVNELIDVEDGVTDVTNIAAFTGGTDEEDIEVFRTRLLAWVRSPQTGSPTDLVNWALEVAGVESATAFQNDNLGTPTNGHATVRIAGPAGTVPPADVVTAVFDNLVLKDVANVTIHVGTFTAVPTNVTVALTLKTGYTLTDVTPAVQAAISKYINSVPVGGTLYIAGIIDAVYGDIPGVATLTVSVPATDLTSTATQKRTPGVITVT